MARPSPVRQEPRPGKSKAISAPATCSTFGMRSSHSMRSRSWSCISRASTGVTSQGWRCSAFIKLHHALARSMSGAFFQFGEDELGDFPQRFEDAFSFHSNGVHNRFALEAQMFAELIFGHDVGEIALVELQHVGNGVELELVFFQMLFEIFE